MEMQGIGRRVMAGEQLVHSENSRRRMGISERTAQIEVCAAETWHDGAATEGLR